MHATRSHTLTVTAATPGLQLAGRSHDQLRHRRRRSFPVRCRCANGEQVAIPALDGRSEKATVDNGAFSSTFNTAVLGVGKSPYTITYSYAGATGESRRLEQHQCHAHGDHGHPRLQLAGRSRDQLRHRDDDPFGRDLAGAQR